MCDLCRVVDMFYRAHKAGLQQVLVDCTVLFDHAMKTPQAVDVARMEPAAKTEAASAATRLRSSSPGLLELMKVRTQQSRTHYVVLRATLEALQQTGSKATQAPAPAPPEKPGTIHLLLTFALTGALQTGDKIAIPFEIGTAAVNVPRNGFAVLLAVNVGNVNATQFRLPLPITINGRVQDLGKEVAAIRNVNGKDIVSYAVTGVVNSTASPSHGVRIIPMMDFASGAGTSEAAKKLLAKFCAPWRHTTDKPRLQKSVKLRLGEQVFTRNQRPRVEPEIGTPVVTASASASAAAPAPAAAPVPAAHDKRFSQSYWHGRVNPVFEKRESSELLVFAANSKAIAVETARGSGGAPCHSMQDYEILRGVRPVLCIDLATVQRQLSAAATLEEALRRLLKPGVSLVCEVWLCYDPSLKKRAHCVMKKMLTSERVEAKIKFLESCDPLASFPSHLLPLVHLKDTPVVPQIVAGYGQSPVLEQQTRLRHAWLRRAYLEELLSNHADLTSSVSWPVAMSTAAHFERFCICTSSNFDQYRQKMHDRFRLLQEKRLDESAVRHAAAPAAAPATAGSAAAGPSASDDDDVVITREVTLEERNRLGFQNAINLD